MKPGNQLIIVRSTHSKVFVFVLIDKPDMTREKSSNFSIPHDDLGTGHTFQKPDGRGFFIIGTRILP